MFEKNIRKNFYFYINLYFNFCFLFKILKKAQYIKVFGYCFFIVKSGSMEPEILKDELIVTKEMDTYNKNEIITFFYDEIVITHRIIEKNNNEFITKGDFNNEIDFPITSQNILGKVLFHSRIL